MSAIDPMDHASTRYAIDVIEGSVPAGRMVRLAAARHLDDLENASDRGLIFDTARATRPIIMSKQFRHTKGRLQGRPFEPLAWQEFVIGSVYGWVYEETGLRRFRTGYNQIAKKNGKTTFAGIPVSYGLLFDGEGEPDIFATATARDQAKLLFNSVRSMLRSSVLAPLLEFREHEIRCPGNGGVVRPLTREANTADGSNPSLVVADEVHRMPDGDLVEILRLSMIARAQPLMWMITTAGQTMASYCGTQRQYSEDVLTGKVQDDAQFAYVSEPDIGDEEPDILDPVLHAQANPSLGTAFPGEELVALGKKALEIPSQIPDFKRYHLNLWTAGGETWMPDEVWMRGGDESLALSWFEGREVWGGLDLSSTTDTTAFVIVAKGAEPESYALWRWIWLPEGRLVQNGDRDKVDYNGFKSLGWLEATPGDVIDYATIFDTIREVCGLCDVKEIACDPAMMGGIYNLPGCDAVPFVEHRQNTMALSPPMKEFERLSHKGSIAHCGDALLRAQFSNVVVTKDGAGNIYPNKKKATGRIDAPVAAIMALGRAWRGNSVATIDDHIAAHAGDAQPE